jgi:hypothetical protein
MKSIHQRILALIPALLTMALLSACGTPKIKPWNVSVQKTTGSTVEVDLVGVTDLDRASWEKYDMNKYWRAAGNERRASADKVSFNVAKGKTEVIQISDPIWKKWMDRGATELMVTANFPGEDANLSRQFIPLNKKLYKKNDLLEIEIRDNLIQVMTPRKPR